MLNILSTILSFWLWLRSLVSTHAEFEEKSNTEQPVACTPTPPPGLYPSRKSTSVPDLLRRLRAHKIHVPMPNTLQELSGSFDSSMQVLVNSRCNLTTSARESTVRVTVQYLRNDISDYIKIFRHRKCVLNLDRRLLRFAENADRLEIALNAKSGDYDWWLLQFEPKYLHAYYSLHYHILTDSSI
jgi:hypothetical protein